MKNKNNVMSGLLKLLIFLVGVNTVSFGQIYKEYDLNATFKDVGNTVLLTDRFAFIGDPSLDETQQRKSVVIVYEKVNEKWIYRKSIKFPSTRKNSFGKTIAYGDGKLFVADDYNNTVYVFDSFGYFVMPEYRLEPLYPLREREFGKTIQVDEHHLIIGSVTKARGLSNQRGIVHVYHKVNNEWTFARFLNPGNATRNKEGFGSVLKLKGNTLIVSSNNSIAYNKPGDVMIYKYTNGKWNFTQRLESEDNFRMNGFGYSVAFIGDELFVGAGRRVVFEKKDDLFQYQRTNVFNGGEMHCYKKNEMGRFVKDTIIKCPDHDRFPGFGFSATVSEDIMYVGVHHNPKANVFVYKKNCLGNWQFFRLLTSKGHNSVSSKGYAIDSKGMELFMGGPRANSIAYFSRKEKGEAYFYRFDKDTTDIAFIKETRELKYVSPSGLIKYQSDHFRDTILNASGCDSIIDIKLTILNTEEKILDENGEVVGTFKLNQMLDVEKSVRNLIVKDTIITHEALVKITFYDNGRVDGDSISIQLNNNWYIVDYELVKDPKVLNIKLKEGKNKLIFRAENIGQDPPNTSRVVIESYSGNTHGKYNVKSDLDDSNIFIIYYLPEKE